MLIKLKYRTFFFLSGDTPTTHPGESKKHLHLCHPPPHAGSHAHAKRDEAVGVVLVEAGRGPVAVAAGCFHLKPSLRDELLWVFELRLVVAGRVVAQVELSLQSKHRRVC